MNTETRTIQMNEMNVVRIVPFSVFIVRPALRFQRVSKATA
jgi:hypothetical protein